RQSKLSLQPNIQGSPWRRFEIAAAKAVDADVVKIILVEQVVDARIQTQIVLAERKAFACPGIDHCMRGYTRFIGIVSIYGPDPMDVHSSKGCIIRLPQQLAEHRVLSDAGQTVATVVLAVFGHEVAELIFRQCEGQDRGKLVGQIQTEL